MNNDYKIVVLHYKTLNKTINCIESILNDPFHPEILLLDNYSNDGTFEELESLYSRNSRIKFLQMPENLGFAKANNYAMKHLLNMGYKYAVLSNNDIEFTIGAAQTMIDALRNNSKAIVAAPKVLSPDNKIQDSVQPHRDNGIMYLIHLLIPKRSVKYAEKNSKISEVELFSGCCFACDLEKMDICSYMDESTFLYYEESIISAKAKAHNYSIVYCPGATVIHHHASTTKLINEKALGYMLDSEIHYMKEYLRIPKSILRFYVRIRLVVHQIKYSSEELKSMEEEVLKRI